MQYFKQTNKNRPSIAYSELESQQYRSSPLINTNSVMYTRDWRSALRSPPTYRIGNRTVRFNFYFVLLLVAICTLSVFFFYTHTGSTSSSDAAWLKRYASSTSMHSSSSTYGYGRTSGGDASIYNATYPLTPPLHTRGGAVTYRIAMVADMDTNSKITKDDGSIMWRSFLKKGYLSYTKGGDIKIKWDDGEPIALESSFALKGRGMELSELVTFNGKLLTFDDRTGLIYEIDNNNKPIPWVILLDGNGHSQKGFKSEWATVKQQSLFVGSMGKEWTTSLGEFENENPMYVKNVKPNGEKHSLDWSFNYKLMRQDALQITWPGYMIHESGLWSEKKQKWFFLPRRCSKEKYNETRDEHMGCNVLIAVDERFTQIETVVLDATNKTPTHGFSSFKFIPGTDDRIIVALKTEELNGKTSTYIIAFDIEGKTVLPEQKIDSDLKYEGFEFI